MKQPDLYYFETIKMTSQARLKVNTKREKENPGFEWIKSPTSWISRGTGKIRYLYIEMC